MGARFDFLHLRRPAAFAVAVLALESVLYGLGGRDGAAGAVRHGLHAGALAGATRVAALLVGLGLLALTPRLWRGTRTAVTLTIGALIALAALNAAHGRLDAAGLQAGLALMLALGRRSFRLGCSNRPRPAIALTAVIAWGLSLGALLLAPLVRHAAGHVLAHVLHHPAPSVHLAAATPWLDGAWGQLIEVLIGAAAATSVLALRSLLSPARAADGPSEREYREARAIVDAHGDDSLTPFLVRPDKALAFAAGGVLSYRVVGGTAIVSADPVAPGDDAAAVLAAFQDHARSRGWGTVVWGASSRHLAAYRRLGLRAVCVGEEAFVDPAAFSLEGRAVRKLRQSVHRIMRRGWTIEACDGRDIGAGLELEIEELAHRWRLDHPHVHGFAMGMGEYAPQLRPDDLYVLARSPEGTLGAVMRFVRYAQNLSLDTMQRVGDTPNGLNEALVVRALEVARERGIGEVSLNYAGLAHLVRREPSRSRIRRALMALVMAPLHRRFQMDRLVRFNDKFSPQWRPRYLVYESPIALPGSILRVLQAEGYLPHPRPSLLLTPLPRILPRMLPARARQRGALSEPR